MIKRLLIPVSWLYGFVVSMRNQLYDLGIFKSKEFDIPVISVGNITVGGTGKTPHTEYLVSLLKEKYRVVTLSRGYKRKTKGFRWVESNSRANESGDEPLQIKKKFDDVKVAVCENRVLGVENILNRSEIPPDVVILDDAFQHRRIKPGINILLIDYTRQLKDDMLLPAGRLRESAYQIQRANIIVFTKCPDELSPIKRRILQNDVKLKPYQALYFTKIAYQKIKPVFNAPELGTKFYSDNSSFEVLAVSGIANPEPMFKHLQKFSAAVNKLVFPDHYHFTSEDIKKIIAKFDELKTENKIIITTEKDAMRFADLQDIPEEVKKALYFLPLEIQFLGKENKSFNKKILSYVGENKSNRELHHRKNKR